MKYSDRPDTYINAQDIEIAIVKATTYGDALKALREAPSIDIVRCAECKWFDSKGHCMRLTAKYGIYEDVGLNDFCSYGERREP